MSNNQTYARLTGRMILKGRLKLLSPLIIGGGDSRWSDSDIVVLKDRQGKPYIPGTSLAGVLRDRFCDLKYTGDRPDYKLQKALFWGTGPVDSNTVSVDSTETEQILAMIRNGCQSALVVSDALPTEEATIVIRDGVKIDSRRGVAEQGKKYDYEVVEAGVHYDLYIEVKLRQAFDKEIFKLILNWIKLSMEKENIPIGAMTGSGFGRCRLEEATLYHFDYKNQDHVTAWLGGDLQEWEKARINVDELPLPDEVLTQDDQYFSIDAWFSIKNSLIVRSYSVNPEAPDSVHFRSADEAILPGTSLRGAIRARAERITHTLGATDDELIHNLFGWVKTDKKGRGMESALTNHESTENNQKEKPGARRGRITIEESRLDMNHLAEEIQHRICIDRFTGGAINSKLFDSMPLWPLDDGEHLGIQMSVKKCEGWEPGLLMLVLKDMWTGDLPLGGENNVGRGVLEGRRAVLKMPGGKIIELNQGIESVVKDQDAEELQKTVQALLDKVNHHTTGRCQ